MQNSRYSEFGPWEVLQVPLLPREGDGTRWGVAASFLCLPQCPLSCCPLQVRYRARVRTFEAEQCEDRSHLLLDGPHRVQG